MGEKIWRGEFSSDPKEMDEFYQVMGPLYAYKFLPNADSSAIEINYNLDVLNYGWSDFLKRFDFTDSLANIYCPTLILQGAQDWIFDVEQAHSLHANIKNSDLKIYDECSHMLWTDQWERFSNDVAEFLGK